MASSINHRKSLINGLKRSQDLNQFCDVTLVTTHPKTDSMECHKNVLAACSSYFREEFKTTDVMVLDETPYSINILREAVDFIYTGLCRMTNNNAYQMLKLSDKWDLMHLFSMSIDFISTHLTTDNVVMYANVGGQYRAQQLIESTSEYIRRHFNEMWCKLQDLDEDVFISILHKDEIQVESEDLIFLSVVDWLEGQPHGTDIKSLLEVIRFDQMSAEFLQNHVQGHPRIRSQPLSHYRFITLALDLQNNGVRYDLQRCKRYWKHSNNPMKIRFDIEEELKSDVVHILPSSETDDYTMQLVPTPRDTVNASIRQSYHTSRCDEILSEICRTGLNTFGKSRNNNDTNKDIQLINQGTRLLCWDQEQKMFGYNDKKYVWDYLMKIPDWCDATSAMCSYVTGPIFVGAYHKQKGQNVSLLDLTIRDEIPLPDLPNAVAVAGVTCTGSHLYVFGGVMFKNNTWSSTRKMYCYPISSDEDWHALNDLPIEVMHAVTTSNQNYIFVLGGNPSNRARSTIQIYNITTSTWTVGHDIPEPCMRMRCGAITDGDDLIVFTQKSRMGYDVEKDQWCSSMHGLPCEEINVFMCAGSLLACVQTDANTRLIYQYDAFQKKWTNQYIDASIAWRPSTMFPI